MREIFRSDDRQRTVESVGHGLSIPQARLDRHRQPSIRVLDHESDFITLVVRIKLDDAAAERVKRKIVEQKTRTLTE